MIGNQVTQNLGEEVCSTGASVSEGDYVKYKEGKGVLHCGSSAYERALVAFITPFVLVSEWCDMVWSKTIDASQFEKCGEAGRKELLAVINRLKQEIYSVA